MIIVINASQSQMIKGTLKRSVKESFGEMDSMNSVRLDMGKAKLLDLSDELSSLPLGCDKKCVIAENFFYLAKTTAKKKIKKEEDDDDKPLLAYFASPDPDIYCFITVYSATLDDKSPFMKALKDGGAKFLTIAEMDEASWRKFIPAYFTKRGGSISDEAIGLLIERCGNDYSTLIQEAQKLIAYSNGDIVAKKDVDALVSKPLEENAFLLSDALIKRNKAMALEIYADLRVKNSSAVSLFNMLANQFLILDQVRYLRERGFDKMAIASSLGVTPGRVGASFYNLRNLSKDDIRKALDMIYSYEGDIFAGKMDDKLAFELFILNF